MSDLLWLQPVPRSVSQARRFVAERTDDLSPAVRDALELCVSELASNCVLHAVTRYSVTVIRVDDCVRIEVADVGLGSVQPRNPSDNDLRGRGLRIVAALADSWGVRPADRPPGKTVWAVFDLVHGSSQGASADIPAALNQPEPLPPIVSTQRRGTVEPSEAANGETSGQPSPHARVGCRRRRVSSPTSYRSASAWSIG